MGAQNISKVRSIGGSLVVTIPREIVKSKSITEGELIKLTIEKPKKDFFGALKGIGSFTRKDRTGDRKL